MTHQSHLPHRDKIATRKLLLCLILLLVVPNALPIYVSHVLEAGRSVTLSCPLLRRNTGPDCTTTPTCPTVGLTWTRRTWSWGHCDFEGPRGAIYSQARTGAVSTTYSRPDLSLNTTDFSLTIGSLQIQDNGDLDCRIYPTQHTSTIYRSLIVYNRWLAVAEYTEVTLHCPLAATDFTTRQWYRDDIDDRRLIYNQTTSAVTTGPYVRHDTSLDNSTFNLTLGSTWLSLDKYICQVTTAESITFDITYLAAYSVELVAEENTPITLPCDSSGDGWQRMNGDILFILWDYDGGFYVESPAARSDMSMDTTTKQLTIGHVQLEDDTVFMCTLKVKLTIYINPKIILSGLDETPVSVGTTVTVTCTIARMYPELRPDDFQMRWGTEMIMSTGSQNDDKSHSYTVQYTHTVTNDDNGTVVECLVTPSRGQSESISKTIMTTNAQLTDQNLPLSLPVIGGAVAAAAVVLMVIIVAGIACICRRRKGRVNTETNEPQRSGESQHRQDTDLPEATGRDTTYLPGVDYHVYVEVDAPGQAPTASDQRPYEKLQTRLNASSLINKWFKKKAMSASIVKKLKRHKILTIQDLKDMSREDMVEAGLKVGERNQIKRVLGDGATLRF